MAAKSVVRALCVALSCIVSSASVSAQTAENWKSLIQPNGWAVIAQSQTVMALYRGPITSTPEGYRRIWERWEQATPQDDVTPAYRSEVTLVEFDCVQARMRVRQRDTFVGNNLTGGVGFTFNGVSDWTFLVPGSLGASEMDVACPSNQMNHASVGGIPPVAYASVVRAASTLKDAVMRGGIIGAEKVSRACFAGLTKRRSWGALEYCIAFDDAAAALDAGMAMSIHTSPQPYFISSARARRAVIAIGSKSHSRQDTSEWLQALDSAAIRATNSVF